VGSISEVETSKFLGKLFWRKFRLKGVVKLVMLCFGNPKEPRVRENT